MHAAHPPTPPHPAIEPLHPTSQPGLHTFSQPRLPVDLNAGYPDRYTSKTNDAEASPVDTIVEAASSAGVDWQVGGWGVLFLGGGAFCTLAAAGRLAMGCLIRAPSRSSTPAAVQN